MIAARRGCSPPSVALVLALAWTQAVAAQDQPPRERKNGVYGELFGASFGLSANYERILTPRFSARVGAGVVADDPPGFGLIAGSNFVILGRRHQLIAGAGLLVVGGTAHPDRVDAGAALYLELGYRYCSKSGFLLRATLAGLPTTWNEPDPLWFMPGVSLGWSF